MAKDIKTARGGKAVSGTKKKTTTKKRDTQKSAPVKTAESVNIPVRLISSTVCILLFVVFLVLLFTPEGVVPKLIYSVILGVIGKVGFYVSIPALLYMFCIHAFSGKRPIVMRTTCLIVFTVLCGTLYHMGLDSIDLGEGAAVIGNLYEGGITGTTGGLLCGSLAICLSWLCGKFIAYLILIIAAIFTLLASMQITILSIIRAFQNRPRADWETEERKERREPAAVVVDHLARKRIERIETRRRTKEIMDDEPAPVKPSRKKTATKGKDIMREIYDAGEPAVLETPETSTEAVKEPLVWEPVPAVETLELPKPAAVEEPAVPVTEPPAPVEEIAPVVPEPAPTKVTAKEAAASAVEVAEEIARNEAVEKPIYCFPPIDLLKRSRGGAADGTAEMRENTRRLNETLASFKIEAHIINVTRGPSVTRYEVELEKGVRLSKLTGVADDIALSLGASGVRIAAVPGKISVVGIEVPNCVVTTVSLREVIDSNEFAKSRSKSSFAVGKDIGGSCIVGNIAKLPHMLIAGTTGSGKSVCMNSIIISLLYKASPDDVKLIMVDPKMVELGIYNGIPHLLIPVVTDPKKAAGSLQWAVTEMMRRYRAMSDAGVRDLESYNSILANEEDAQKLPQVVVIIDELADLMLVAAKEVEESICRIAQMGRAAGIHLIIATQRPSADVITGLMKANIPSRIAFSVASAMESRIILDTQGAEKLVGRGDMLFAPIGIGKPMRVQGCFVSDSEVEAVATYVKEHYHTSYDQAVMEEIERKAVQTGSGKPGTASDPEPSAEELDGDEMLPAAVDVILETGQASVSMLQRRLKLGYARAARIVDEMEEKGIVGPFQGSKPRAILITKEAWAAMKSGKPAQMTMDELPVDEDGTEDFE